MIVSLLLVIIGLPILFTWTSPENRIAFLPAINEEIGILRLSSKLISPSGWWYFLFAGLVIFGLTLFIGFLSRRSNSYDVGRGSVAIRAKLTVILGAISLTTYSIFFLIPFPLHIYYNFRRVSIGWIADRNAVAAIGTSIAIVTLFLLYYFAYRLCLGQRARRLWIIVLVCALLFSIINFFAFTFSSTDIYDYVSRGRISGVLGGNPYVQVPNDFPDDPYVQLAAWKTATSAYGPLWEMLSGLVGRFSGDQLWISVLAYKGLALAGYFLCTGTIAATLRRISPKRALSGTLLFAWNPLILLEGIANVHNDLLMIAFVLGGLSCLGIVIQNDQKDRTSSQVTRDLVIGAIALVLLGMAVLIKFIPILLFPPFLMVLLVREKGWKRKLGLGFLVLIPVVLIFLLYFLVFWQWPEITNTFISRINMFRMSLGSVTKEILQDYVGVQVAAGVATWPYLIAFAITYLIVLARMAHSLRASQNPEMKTSIPHRNRIMRIINRFLFGGLDDVAKQPWDILVAACLSIFVFYLLLGSLWFWPWYLIWPIALLALSVNLRWVIVLTVIGCAGQLSHILWNFVWYWMGITWDNLYRVDKVVVLLMLVPALCVYLLSRGVNHRFQLQESVEKVSTP